MTAARPDMPPLPPLPPTVRPAGRTGTWLRYNWHKLLAHAMLVLFGLANLYPFFWMLGTSLKDEAVASAQRQTPLPDRKWKLADGYDLPEVLPWALAGERGPVGVEQITRRLQLIDALQRPSGAQAEPAIDAGQYARISRLPPAGAAAELDELARKGVLVAMSDAEGADAEQRRYRLADGARGAIHDGLLPRQVLTLISMSQENARRGESRSTYARDTRSVRAYARSFSLPLPVAAAELAQLQDKGHLASSTALWINYWIVLKEENFLLHFLTTLLMTLLVVFGTVMIASMLGYALARLRFPGKMLVLGLMIAGAVAPREAVIIPIFKMLKSVGLLDSMWGMILWMTANGVGQALLMAGFFLSLPREVEEAASVDGAGVFRGFFDVALPMARPIVMTVGMFAFLGAWNNFLVPLLCTVSRPSMQPLAVAVYNFQRGHGGKWQLINAAASVMVIPVIVMFLAVQKHVVRAIAVGAVKG